MDCGKTRVRDVIRGASAQELVLWQSATMQATSIHLDFAQALETSDLLITHAGHSTVCQALLAGVPMVLIPRSLETHLTARAAVNAGAAVIARFAADGEQGIIGLTASIEMVVAQGIAAIGEKAKQEWIVH